MIAPARAALALFVMLTALGLAVAGPAQAGSSEAERQARRSFQVAENHFRAGRFAEALAEYQAGYEKLPLPGFLINIAQCQRRLGDLQKARTTYQKFVMVAPDSPHVAEVKTLIAELDKLIADLENQQKPAASPEPAADTTPAPAEAPPKLTPAEPAAPAAAPPVLVAASSAQAEPPPPHASKTRWWLWGLIGAAVAGGAVATYALTASPATTTVHEGTLGTLRR